MLRHLPRRSGSVSLAALVLLAAVFALAHVGGAYAKPAPPSGTACTGETACRELARTCPGSFVQVVAVGRDGARTVLGWCEVRKNRQLHCSEPVSAGSCGALKNLCIAAKGVYNEKTTVDPDDGGVTTTGTCTLPKPRKKEGEVTIFCTGKQDCSFLSGFCTGQGGTFARDSPTQGSCTYTPKPQ